MCEPQLSTVVFRAFPLANADADTLNSTIRQRLFASGRAVIGHTRVRNQQCLKFTCMNPSTTEAQLKSLIQAILQEANRTP
jgi:L-2,4-diaminobutyrate decarboxylase